MEETGGLFSERNRKPIAKKVLLCAANTRFLLRAAVMGRGSTVGLYTHLRMQIL